MSAPAGSVSPPAALQLRVLGLAYLAYFLLYFSRKSLGLTTGALVADGYSEAFIGWVQTAFAVMYAAGQFAAGALGDRLGPRLGLSAGLLLAAAASLAFGAFPSAVMLAVTITLSGLFQAAGWPNCCCLVAVWTSEERRGRITSLWLTSYMLGGLAASFAGGLLLEHLGWRHVFLWTGAALLAGGICLLLWLINAPEDCGGSGAPVAAPRAEGESVRTGFAAMIREPAVLWLGFAYTGIRLARYGVFLWLPYYLATEARMGDRAAAWTSAAFEAGGLAGILAAGWAADRWFRGRQFRLALYLMIALTLSLLLWRTGSGAGMVAALALTGLLMYAADTVIAGTAVTEIGGREHAAAAAGIVNGIGSTAQVCAGILPIWVKQHWGWDGVFASFLGLTLLSSAILTVPALRRK